MRSNKQKRISRHQWRLFIPCDGLYVTVHIEGGLKVGRVNSGLTLPCVGRGSYPLGSRVPTHRSLGPGLDENKTEYMLDDEVWVMSLKIYATPSLAKIYNHFEPIIITENCSYQWQNISHFVIMFLLSHKVGESEDWIDTSLLLWKHREFFSSDLSCRFQSRLTIRKEIPVRHNTRNTQILWLEVRECLNEIHCQTASQAADEIHSYL